MLQSSHLLSIFVKNYISDLNYYFALISGAYFCFITLSTIGFGDIVPGFSHEDWNDQVKLVACSCYLLIGLSTLAMCFELMQHKGQKVARRCAQFVGLMHK